MAAWCSGAFDADATEFRRRLLFVQGQLQPRSGVSDCAAGLPATASGRLMANELNFLTREIAGARDLLPLAGALPQRYPCLLESAAYEPERARFDVLLAFPQNALTLRHGTQVRDESAVDHGPSFLEALHAAWSAERVAWSNDTKDTSAHLPFRGGWAIFLGYEIAAEIEPGLRLPEPADVRIPTALALRCPAAVIVDRLLQQTWLIAEPAHANCLDSMQADLDAQTDWRFSPLDEATTSEDDPAKFLDGVARIHDHLRAGDVFQANLSREWRACFANAPAPAALYASLRNANPAPFAGLLQWENWAIASSSPERLVEVRGDLAQTRPIAGTRPRESGDDEASRLRELIGHPKERAEHVMLIDLERNDLGRICVPGSVVVDELMTLESYAHVHHIVSNVSGRLRPGTSPVDVIRAVFPGGTITGCPKVRCMQIIAELEGIGRGVYTGALGYLNRDGDMDLNILIRSLSLGGDEVRLRAGAGIVADSDAVQELAETRAKARGLLRALGAST
jgi:anthranilate synthase component I